MSLAQLQIYHLRNITAARLDLHPKLNFIFGANGSGKTSFLEAIYLLGTGHSFRSREILPLITREQEALTVFARTSSDETISIQKALGSPTQVRLNGTACQASSELARFLPCQIFYQDIFQIIDAGPAVRRAVLDWGLFHVKQNYHDLWKHYKRALKQRNALLRQRASKEQLLPWNKILDQFGNELHQARLSYVQKLLPFFNQISLELSNIQCSFEYFKGWDRRETGKSLLQILESNYEQDIARQFSQYGPHQADLLFRVEANAAKQYLSRGQQKILLFALKLAQAHLTQKPCLYLFDDFTSELDEAHVNRLLQHMKTLSGQVFITTLALPSLSNLPDEFKLFQVDNGSVKEIERLN
nr:DNA replication/repair protein RecF [Legionella jordanis]